MILAQLIACFVGVIAVSIMVEVPKKYILVAGIVGAINWGTYLVCKHFNLPDTLSYFISALIVAIISIILSKILKVISTIFLMPSVFPIVPGVAMYKMIYYLINNNHNEAMYYLLEAVFIAAGIALAIFITESIKNIKIIRKEQVNENKI